jgi:hypothetical protein
MVTEPAAGEKVEETELAGTITLKAPVVAEGTVATWYTPKKVLPPLAERAYWTLAPTWAAQEASRMPAEPLPSSHTVTMTGLPAAVMVTVALVTRTKLVLAVVKVPVLVVDLVRTMLTSLVNRGVSQVLPPSLLTWKKLADVQRVMVLPSTVISTSPVPARQRPELVSLVKEKPGAEAVPSMRLKGASMPPRPERERLSVNMAAWSANRVLKADEEMTVLVTAGYGLGPVRVQFPLLSLGIRYSDVGWLAKVWTSVRRPMEPRPWRLWRKSWE